MRSLACPAIGFGALAREIRQMHRPSADRSFGGQSDPRPTFRRRVARLIRGVRAGIWMDTLGRRKAMPDGGGAAGGVWRSATAPRARHPGGNASQAAAARSARLPTPYPSPRSRRFAPASRGAGPGARFGPQPAARPATPCASLSLLPLTSLVLPTVPTRDAACAAAWPRDAIQRSEAPQPSPRVA